MDGVGLLQQDVPGARVPDRQHGQAHREVVAVCAGVTRDQAELERLVFLRGEGWRTDLNKTLLDEDLEIFRVRQGGAGHHPYGVLRPYLQARVESVTVECSDRHLGVDLDLPGVGFSCATF